MTVNGRPAYDLLREWIANDHPVYHFGCEVVEVNRKNGTNYGAGLRDFILDIRSTILPPTFPGGTPLCRAYLELCDKMAELPDYPHGYPRKPETAIWTMDAMSDREFGTVPWMILADDVFPATEG